MAQRFYNMPTGYLPQGYQQHYNPNQRFVQQPKSKRSGAKLGTDKKSRPVVTAWNKSKSRGFIKMVAIPCNKTKTKSPNSDKWVATVTFPDGKKTFTAFWNVNTKKLTIPDLEMVANPSKNYFGTFVKRR
ncbi:hypothetical protein [Carboxylicivirga sp. M1479]|uniref:hypothetical protein n=1 Tax=Carboxylicivirga sp. M1479 TaxID=2594476 RepID=UPI001178A28F|nr:hypothetical protein [Carboxylicivirga sp. M1479]TRX70526.1 hypothetical protein FNN09_11145 [Carboxylicivirga sp. M1479]